MKKIMPEIFKSSDSRFHLRTSLIVAFVPLIPLLFLGFMTWVSMNTTFNFFKANGLAEADLFHEAFSDYVMLNASTYFPYIAVFFIALFFAGNYLCHLALRPFKKIGVHALNSQKNSDLPWEIDAITNKKMVCQFAKSFFQYLTLSRTNNEFEKVEITDKYEKIKAPVADKIFYFHYFIFVLIISFVFVLGIHLLSAEIHEGFINFAMTMTKSKNQNLSTFLLSQEVLFDSVTIVSVGLVLSIYMFVARNLIASVDGVSYHFFRVMKEIMKGNFSSRVRLRVNDPGQQCALYFNELMDKVLPQKAKNSELPPLPIENIVPPGSPIKVFEHSLGKYGVMINCSNEDELQEIVNKLK